MPDILGGLFFSEILADNPGSGFDTDGDGNTNKADEFVEIQNSTGAAVSLDGFEIWSSENDLLYSFGAGDSIAAGGTATVVGNYNGAEPAGFYDAGINENGNFLRDGEGQKNDTLFLVDTNTGEYIVLSYGANPHSGALPPGFPGTTQIGAGETITSGAPNGIAFTRDADGTLVEGPPTPGNPGPVCYARGTLIRTPDGPQAIETLRPGDLVETLDHGAQPVRWHHSEVQALDGLDADKCPIVIAPHAFAPGHPERALTVSPQHRILVGGNGQLSYLFAAEVLVPAKALVGLPGIQAATDKACIEWHHIALDQHQVIFAEGCLSETLLPGPIALQSISRLGTSILTRESDPDTATPARPLVKVQDARRMITASREANGIFSTRRLSA